MKVRSRLEAMIGMAFLAALIFSSSCGGGDGGVPALNIEGPGLARQGDVVRFSAAAVGFGEIVLPEDALSWTVEPLSAGLITPEGRFVGYESGPADIVVARSGVTGRLTIEITPRNGLKGSFEFVGRGVQTTRFNSDLWLHGRVALTGTWLGAGIQDPERPPGHRMLVWDINDPAAPVPTDEIIVDARTVNDVKIRGDGTLAALTHEGSTDGLNGLTFLDLADPLHPVVITRFTAGLETGVHNVWLEGNFAYAAANGIGVGLRIIDISSLENPLLPPEPETVASFAAQTSFLHDVLVRDGLAFLSHWDDGLIILDVGNGVAGGSPENPVEVSRIATAGGQTHNAWFWPEAGYVFVGEEDFETPGVMHVVDVADLFNPVEVATFSVTGETPHNFWLDEEQGILYAAWYTAGLRAIDVSGELLGELEAQDREIAFTIYGTDAGCRTADGTCTWAPQLHNGLVFLSDLNTGLWVFRPSF